MAYYQKEIETASREELNRLQSERLVNTVRRVYERVPLYRQRMDEAGVKPEDIHGIEDLRKLPFTSKQDLRDTYPYGMFAVPMEEVVRLHASSGTTGKQIVVGYTEKDLDSWAEICARQLVAVGCHEKDKVHVSYGYWPFHRGLRASRRFRKAGVRHHSGFFGQYCKAVDHSSGFSVRIFWPAHPLMRCIWANMPKKRAWIQRNCPCGPVFRRRALDRGNAAEY